MVVEPSIASPRPAQYFGAAPGSPTKAAATVGTAAKQLLAADAAAATAAAARPAPSAPLFQSEPLQAERLSKAAPQHCVRVNGGKALARRLHSPLTAAPSPHPALPPALPRSRHHLAQARRAVPVCAAQAAALVCSRHHGNAHAAQLAAQVSSGSRTAPVNTCTTCRCAALPTACHACTQLPAPPRSTADSFPLDYCVIFIAASLPLSTLL